MKGLQQWLDQNPSISTEEALGLSESVVAAVLSGDVLPTQALLDRVDASGDAFALPAHFNPFAPRL